ncbi:SRPBCC family protein [Egibacter rhizosphaerae]|uniref:SRPBCC family protein n=1 Tax=Egibacter rhizosphaerae TaxID=1670831 RepID=A0A411YB15_9ACTN|nr:SRPBCC family protein [Egibacter rhizosphaerae]QBI18372.1 SRPBCC family protein [Egibacter rhizosphaerae]
MSQVKKSIEVESDVTTVYNQWTQFEEFPQFMEGVQSVEQIDDAHLAWTAQIGPSTREWEAEITEQVPDQLIEWRALGDVRHDGHVRFESLDGGRTRVTLRLDFEPESFAEKAVDALHIVDKRVEGDLERFKAFIEERQIATGSYRQEIH